MVNKNQQPAGEEAAPASSNNGPPKPPAYERQEEQAPETKRRTEEPAEEDANKAAKGDPDRKRQADDTIEQNDHSPPKRGVGRPAKVFLLFRGKDTRLQRITSRRVGSTRQLGSRSQRESSQTRWKKKQTTRSPELRKK